jgi:hypothetical protein
MTFRVSLLALGALLLVSAMASVSAMVTAPSDSLADGNALGPAPFIVQPPSL